MNVYYNTSFGCLVCPETRMGNTPMRVVIEPATVLDSGSTASTPCRWRHGRPHRLHTRRSSAQLL